jgi:hypothetical protein
VNHIKKSVFRFKPGEKACEEQSWIDRPTHFLGQSLRDFLQAFPCAMAIMIAQPFGRSRHIIKDIFQRELGLWHFSRRWVPHSLTDSQIKPIAKAKELSAVFQDRGESSFDRIVTNHESRFACIYQSDRSSAQESHTKLCSHFCSQAVIWWPWVRSHLIKHTPKIAFFIIFDPTSSVGRCAVARNSGGHDFIFAWRIPRLGSPRNVCGISDFAN